MGVLGLPDSVSACLFDLDGVLTDTARLHAAAWKEMFDDFLREPRGPRHSTRRRATTTSTSTAARATTACGRSCTRAGSAPRRRPGRPARRGDRARASRAARTSSSSSSSASRASRPIPGSVRYVQAARDAGLHRAVVSASANCHDVLRAAGIEQLFEQVIDGIVAQHEHLPASPRLTPTWPGRAP